MTKNKTKEKVVEAASLLFYQKGFDGTSVRDIANKANVNVSLISYYFNGKQGLLEYAVTNYYETYITLIKEELGKNAALDELSQLKNLIYAIIKYKMEYYQLTAFIQRELTLDSTFVREMTVTYLAKENHLLQKLFFNILHPKHKQMQGHLYMQLKGMFMSPFLFKDELNYHFIDETSIHHFTKTFTKTIHLWLDVLVGNAVETPSVQSH